MTTSYSDLRFRAAHLSSRPSFGAELANLCGEASIRLEGNWKKVVKAMPKLEVIRCHTGNSAILHDRLGPYRWVRFIFSAGQTGGPEVDLRLFMKNWRHGYALIQEKGEKVERSLHFLDKYGDAIHSIYLNEESSVEGFNAVVQEFRSADQSKGVTYEQRKSKPEKPDSEVDVEAFRKKWRKMWDTHQFFSLHRKFGLSRIQALRLGPPELVRPLPLDAARQLFKLAAQDNVPFMTFSGNRGCLQIHNGVATQFSNGGEWFHVEEGGFGLHIHEPSIAHAYEVKKPTFFGNVTSVELYDEKGENVAVFYGKRGRLEKEHADWRSLVTKLPGKKEPTSAN